MAVTSAKPAKIQMGQRPPAGTAKRFFITAKYTNTRTNILVRVLSLFRGLKILSVFVFVEIELRWSAAHGTVSG